MNPTRYHAGVLSDLGELQRKVETPDGAGGVSVTWELLRPIWCNLKTLGGTQALEAGRRQSSTTHEIGVRYQDDVDPSVVTQHRIVIYGVPYNLTHAIIEGRREFVRIGAVSGVAT